MTIKRLLLLRRRIDPLLLGGGIAALAFMLNPGKIAFLFFAVCGLYLAAIRHRASRRLPKAFSALLLAWAVWQIGLSLMRGEPLDGNRVLSYAAIEFAMVFLPVGLCLVPRPVDALATGARLALVGLVIAAPVDFLLSGGRVGLGRNEAIFAFLSGVVALAARLPAARPRRWLPNGAGWVYLSAVPIVFSGTRAALVVLVMAAIVDALRYVRRLRAGGHSMRRRAIALAVVVLAVLAWPVGSIVGDRFESGLTELRDFQATGDVKGSVDVRLVMWSSAVAVISEHPLIGVGGVAKMQAAGDQAGRNAYMVTYYPHLHNFILDEAISSGLIGLALMLATFAAFLRTVFRKTADRTYRETALLLIGFLGVFGCFHGVLLNEWTLIALFGTMGTMLAGLGRPGAAARKRA